MCWLRPASAALQSAQRGAATAEALSRSARGHPPASPRGAAAPRPAPSAAAAPARAWPSVGLTELTCVSSRGCRPGWPMVWPTRSPSPLPCVSSSGLDAPVVACGRPPGQAPATQTRAAALTCHCPYHMRRALTLPHAQTSVPDAVGVLKKLLGIVTRVQPPARAGRACILRRSWPAELPPLPSSSADGSLFRGRQ
jgi:hypothetical protein